MEYPFSCRPDSGRDDHEVAQAALAILLARYQDVDEVSFGVDVDVAEVDGARKMDVWAKKVSVDGALTIVGFLESVRAAAVNHVLARQDGLHVALASRSYNNTSSTHHRYHHTSQAHDGDNVRNNVGNHLHPCSGASTAEQATPALLLECRVQHGNGILLARYDEVLLQAVQIPPDRFLPQMAHIIAQLYLLPDQAELGDIELISPEDRRDVLEWNSNPPVVIEACIHNKISCWAAARPHKSAIAAWDGHMTYSDLDWNSSRLASHLLQSCRLEREQPVLICSEKSKWVVLAMLAVLKAGGALVLIDPSLPVNRVAQISRQTSAKLALITEKQRNFISQACVASCVLLSDDLYSSLPSLPGGFESLAKPEDLAYYIFTSGSTGEPKGTMIEHRGFVSCCLEFAPAFGICEESRTLQFASYAFGACLVEILGTLMLGGCVCIPSEQERQNDLEDFISRHEVNWAVFVPSFLRVLRPDRIPSLKVLNTGGEAMTQDVRDIWADHVRLVYVYGQSESSTCCTFTDITGKTSDMRNIGRPIGARCWITDANNIDQLAPVGCVGELVIESPGIARGYLNSPEGQKTAFLDSPPLWYPGRAPHPSVRFYRTGDLACYAVNGSIRHMGRKDRQIKISGQRLDLGDIETHLRRQILSDGVVIAEIVNHPSDASKRMLVAFLSESHQDGNDGFDAAMLDVATTQIIVKKLRHFLPQHSIPSLYIRMQRLPTTATGKIDRRRLQHTAIRLLTEVDSHESEFDEERAVPFEKNSLPRQWWSQALNVKPNRLHERDHFLQLGGDSIAALRVTNTARAAGISITLKDVLENPVFSDFAALVESKSNNRICRSITKRQRSGPTELSSPQGRLWVLEQLNYNSGAYTIPLSARLHGRLNLGALRKALQLLVERHEILRTTFEHRDGVGVQLVHPDVTTTLAVVESPSYEDALTSLHREQTTAFQLPEKPWRATLFRLNPEDHILSIVMHHIIVDG